MKTMKAVCIYAYGDSSMLKYQDAPCPRPSTGEVLIRVYAAGINPVDWKIREGHLKEKLHHTFPLVLGWDVSGVVEALGSDVKHLKVGDEVFSRPDISRDGAYAEFIVIKESEIALKPKSIDHIRAAALPLAGLTAWQTLFDVGALAAGQRVLIHAGAGGVGHLAVQLAKWKGAHVVTTGSARNHSFLKKLGADQIIDYAAVRFEEAMEPVDIILDTMGGEIQERSWKVIKPGGILISIVSPPSAETAMARRARQSFVFIEPNIAQLNEIAKLVETEKLKVTVDTVLTLADAARGQELSERGHARGKIVMRVIESKTPSPWL